MDTTCSAAWAKSKLSEALLGRGCGSLVLFYTAESESIKILDI